MDRRLTDLELRYMKLEKLVDELSEVVAAQQKTLDAATVEIRRLSERLRDLGEETPNERPPHY